jgi:cellulose synthase/poly-beta-1,6-N-acetylglucosamine synthase-like glycosyltransferase
LISIALQYVVWVISFISIYVGIIWLNLLYITEPAVIKQPKRFPRITAAIPAYNEENTILHTLRSVLKVDYPKEKLEVFVINDGSTDNTSKVVRRFMKNHRIVRLLEQENKGKAAALNNCLRQCKGELFACIDADSRINKEAFVSMVNGFEDNSRLGAVVSQIKTINQRNLYEKIQRVEYFISILIRKLMAFLGTLAQTPGALSIYKTNIIKKLGGFDKKSITEDFEMAMRLKYNHYDIKTDETAVTLTHVPRTFMAYLRQRVRWYRGFLVTHFKFRKMFLNKKYGLMGTFQLPINILGVSVLVASVSLLLYHLVRKGIEVVIRMFVIDNYITEYLLDLPTLKELVLSHNVKLMLPIYIGSLVGVYFIYCAHRNAKERFRDFLAIIAYIVIYPYITALHWFTAFGKEIARTQRQW